MSWRELLRKPEIADDYPVVVDAQNVLQLNPPNRDGHATKSHLQVTVNDPLGVHIVDAIEKLSHVGARLLLAQRNRLVEDLEELAFRSHLEDSKEEGRRGEKVVNRNCNLCSRSAGPTKNRTYLSTGGRQAGEAVALPTASPRGVALRRPLSAAPC